MVVKPDLAGLPLDEANPLAEPSVAEALIRNRKVLQLFMFEKVFSFSKLLACFAEIVWEFVSVDNSIL